MSDSIESAQEIIALSQRLKRLLSEGKAGPKELRNYPAQVELRIEAMLRLFPSRNLAASVAGKSPDMVLQYARGDAKPPFEVLARLALATGVSLDWLAAGVGPMMLREPPSAEELERRFGPPRAHAENQFVFVPRFDVRAGAGGGQVVGSEQVSDFLAFREDWVRFRLRRNPADLVVIEAVGDSMFPTIDNGDIILIDRSETRVRDSAIYALGVGDELVVKRVERRLNGSLLVRSDNPIYAAQEVRPEEVAELRVVGRVVWAGGVV